MSQNAINYTNSDGIEKLSESVNKFSSENIQSIPNIKTAKSNAVQSLVDNINTDQSILNDCVNNSTYKQYSKLESNVQTTKDQISKINEQLADPKTTTKQKEELQKQKAAAETTLKSQNDELTKYSADNKTEIQNVKNKITSSTQNIESNQAQLLKQQQQISTAANQITNANTKGRKCLSLLRTNSSASGSMSTGDFSGMGSSTSVNANDLYDLRNVNGKNFRGFTSIAGIDSTKQMAPSRSYMLTDYKFSEHLSEVEDLTTYPKIQTLIINQFQPYEMLTLADVLDQGFFAKLTDFLVNGMLGFATGAGAKIARKICS